MNRIELTGPQTEVFLMENNYPLFVGGYGSGKTQSLICNALRDVLHNPGVRVGAYCPTYDLLKLSLMPRLEEELTKARIRFTMNKSDHICTVETGSQIIMRSMDNPARIVAYEVFRSHVDEIDTLPKKKAQDVWNKIVARNRSIVRAPDGEKLRNQIFAYTTPDHGFSSFTYSRWGKDPGEGYKFVRAPTYSNPHLDSDYVERLKETYDEQLVEAYVKGLWCNITSGKVYRSYDRELCRSEERYRKREPIRVGMDFNANKMAACVFVMRGNKWHQVRELDNGADTPDVCEWLKREFEGSKITVYPDASGNSVSSKNASTSDLSIIKSFGFAIRVNSRNPRVRDRVNSVNMAFSKGIVAVNDETCPVTAECLEQQTYSSSGEPDKHSGHDHQNDAFGYPIVFHHPILRPMSSGSVIGVN